MKNSFLKIPHRDCTKRWSCHFDSRNKVWKSFFVVKYATISRKCPLLEKQHDKIDSDMYEAQLKRYHPKVWFELNSWSLENWELNVNFFLFLFRKPDVKQASFYKLSPCFNFRIYRCCDTKRMPFDFANSETHTSYNFVMSFFYSGNW